MKSVPLLPIFTIGTDCAKVWRYLFMEIPEIVVFVNDIVESGWTSFSDRLNQDDIINSTATITSAFCPDAAKSYMLNAIMVHCRLKIIIFILPANKSSI